MIKQYEDGFWRFPLATLTGPVTTNTACVQSIPIMDERDPSQYQVMYSLCVNDLQPDQIVFIKAQMEVSNNVGYVVSYGWYLIRTDSPASTTGVYLKHPVNATLPPLKHHYVTEMWAFDTDIPAGTSYYNLVGLAKSTDAKPGDSLVVEQGYGDCTVLIFENEGANNEA